MLSTVGECCELWDDPAAWRRHALEGACRIIGSRTAHFIEISIDPATQSLRPRLLADTGFDARTERKLLVESLKEPFENVTPLADRLVDHLFTKGPVCATRPMLLSSVHEWQRFDGFQQFRRPASCDEFAISLRAGSAAMGPCFQIFGLDRSPGDRAVNPREREVLSLLHAELHAREGQLLANHRHLSREGLSRREGQTLDALLQGLSEKEVAARLKLSVPTVHQYVTRLYRHFNVSSRAELMSYFIRRRPAERSASRDR